MDRRAWWEQFLLALNSWPTALQLVLGEWNLSNTCIFSLGHIIAFASLRTIDSAQNYACGGGHFKLRNCQQKKHKNEKNIALNRSWTGHSSLQGQSWKKKAESNLIWLQLGTYTARDWRLLLFLSLLLCTRPWRTAKPARILKFYWVGTVANKESTVMNTGCVCLCGGDLVAK